jgi:hypothetical protein
MLTDVPIAALPGAQSSASQRLHIQNVKKNDMKKQSSTQLYCIFTASDVSLATTTCFGLPW